MIKEIKCQNCGAQLQPNNEGKLIKCPFCDSYYAYDSDSGALIKVNVTNMGTSNVEASTVIINNYYKKHREIMGMIMKSKYLAGQRSRI